jgi:glycosyltransferase involved in cell wall biosynthesis
MRVMQAMAGAHHGGAEVFFERLSATLGARDEIDQLVVIRQDLERAMRLHESGLKVTELPFRGLPDLATRMGFRAAIKHFEPEIVLTWMNRATARCPKSRGRFVHVARLGGYYNLKYYRHCDHLIGNTQGIVDYLVAEGWPASRAHYLPNFVPTERAEPVERKSLQTEEGVPLLLALGRLHDNKAFDVLLHALVDLPEAILWIAGDGPNDMALRKLAAGLGITDRVRFLGWRDDASALLATADVLVCPSRIEPLGNVILEAWAQGIPVVAAAAAGPSALIRDQESGILTQIDDPGSLARGISQIIEDPDKARDLATAGNKTFRTEYSESVVTARYVDFLREVAAGCAE